MRIIWLIALAVIILSGMMVLGGQLGEDSKKSAASMPSPATQSQTVPQSFQPIVFTGSSSKTTAPFSVTTNEWTIQWEYKTADPTWAVFSLFVFPRGETVNFVEAIQGKRKGCRLGN